MQTSDADWERGWCKGPPIHSWRYAGEAIEETELPELVWRDEKPDGMYWRIGLIQFIIDERRGRCIYHYTLGPRYGRGYKAIFDDFSQLLMAPRQDRMLWIS